MEKYFIVLNNEKKGPFSIKELKDKELTSETLVWKKGMQKWQKLHEIEALSELFELSPPPIPSSSKKVFVLPKINFPNLSNYKKSFKIIALLLLLFISVIGFLQFQTIKDSYLAWKYPPTKEYYKTDKEGRWEKIPDEERAEYYRLISYDKNNKPVGLVKDFYIDGQIQWEGHISSVKPFIAEGQCVSYYKNGKVSLRENYKNGKLDGICEKFYKTGELEETTEYHEGLLDGIVKNYTEGGVSTYQQLYEKDSLRLRTINLKELKKKYNETELEAIKQKFKQGNDYMDAGDKKASIATFKELVELAPEYPYAYVMLGHAYVKSDKYEEAIKNYRKFKEFEIPEPYKVENEIAKIHKKTGNYDEAINCYYKAIGDYPEKEPNPQVKADYYNNIGVIYLNNKKNVADAIENFSHAISTDSTEILYYLNLSIAYEDANEDEAAIKIAEKAKRIDKYDEQPYERITNIHILNKDYKSALSEAKAGLNINPANEKLTKKVKDLKGVIYKPSNPQPYGGSSSRRTCGECHGSGKIVCKKQTWTNWFGVHDTNGDGHCQLCGNSGWRLCPSCGGRG